MTGTSIVRLFAAIGFAACGADANTSPTVGSTPPVIPVVKGPPGLTVIAEGSHTDTAGATLPNGLTVLVRDAEGLPMKGVGVQLDATTTGNASAVEPLVFLADNSLFGTASYGAATRADGSLTVRVQFGKKAATVRARISVRSLGLADSVTYSILPASAFRIAVAPSDTLLMIGATLRPLVGVVDQFGNTRDDVVKMELVSGRTVRLDAAGGVVGVDYGRSELDATVSNRLLARIVVTVVPTGALAFFDNGFSAPAIMERFALDGSGYRVLLKQPVVSGDGAPYVPAWSPRGDLAFSEIVDHFGEERLFVMEPGGVPRKLMNGQNGLGVEFRAQYSPDGSWIYFSGRPLAGQAPSIYRVRPDGTGMVRLPTGTISFFSYDENPSLSPDGQRMVFMTNRCLDCAGQGTFLRVLDLLTSQVTELGLSGALPRWSPVTSDIAFLDTRSGVSIAHVDGSGLRVLTPDGQRYEGAPTWSPDGQWLAAYNASASYTEIIRASDGLRLTLPYAFRRNNPAWTR